MGATIQEARIGGVVNAIAPEQELAEPTFQVKTRGNPIVVTYHDSAANGNLLKSIPFNLDVIEIQIVIGNNNATAGEMQIQLFQIGSFVMFSAGGQSGSNPELALYIVAGDTKAFRMRFDSPNYLSISGGDQITMNMVETTGTYDYNVVIYGYPR